MGLALFLLGNSLVIGYGRLYKNYGFRFLKYLFLHILFSLLIVILQLGKLYAIINATQFFPVFSSVQLPMAGLLIILLMMTYSLFILSLYEKSIPPSRKTGLFLLTMIIAVIVVVSNVLLFLTGSFLLLSAVEYIYAAALALASLLLILDKKISANPVNRRIVRMFGIFYIIWFIPFFIHLIVPLKPSLYIYISCQAVQFIIPYVWFQWFFLKNHTWGISCLRDSHCLDRIYREKKITGREREIIELIVQGKSNREIEKELFISIYTVKNHVQNIYAKLGVRSRAKLIHMVVDSQRLIST